MKRKLRILTAAMALAGLALPHHASANVPPAPSPATHEQRQELINKVSNVTLSMLKDSKKSPAERIAALELGFAKVVDTDWIAKFVLGNGWRLATPEQRESFAELYRRYLTRVYVSNYAESSDRKVTAIDLLGINENSGRTAEEDRFVAKTQVCLSQAAPIKVDYLIHQIDTGKYKVIDVTIEGVSLLTTHRAEFGSIVSQKGVDGAIAKLDTLLKDPAPKL